MKVDLRALREQLEAFEFGAAFTECLGWQRPQGREHDWRPMALRGLEQRTLAEQEEAVAVEIRIRSSNGLLPEAERRELARSEIARKHSAYLILFVDAPRSQSLWLWSCRRGAAVAERSLLYLRGQPGRGLLQRLVAVHRDLEATAPARAPEIAQVTSRLRAALERHSLAREFCDDLQHSQDQVSRLIGGAGSPKERRLRTTELWCRLALLAFLQPEDLVGPLRGGRQRLRRSLDQLELVESAQHAPRHRVPEAALDELLQFFRRYSWSLEATSSEAEREVTPEVLGEALALYLQERPGGAPAVPRQVARYLCEQALYPLVLETVGAPTGGRSSESRRHGRQRFESIEELLLGLDEGLCHRLLHEVLPGLRVVDPACGSGTMLVQALEVLTGLYTAVLGRIDADESKRLMEGHQRWRREPGGLGVAIRRRILEHNLYAVDISEEAAELTRLRLHLELMAAAEPPQSAPPRVALKIRSGNALVGLLPSSHPPTTTEFSGSRPFHWQLEFKEVLLKRGGFDAVITSPPWGPHEPSPHEREFFRKSGQYSHQSPPYARHRLFIELAFGLLRHGGLAGLFVPGDIYNAQASRGLWRLLLESGPLRAVLSFSNEHQLLASMHRSVRCCALVFSKGGPTRSFEAAFRVNPRQAVQLKELEFFLNDRASHLELTADLIARVSQDMLTLPEFQSARDIALASKLSQHPRLRDWGLQFRLGPHRMRAAHAIQAVNPSVLAGVPLYRGRALRRYGFDTTEISGAVEAMLNRRFSAGVLDYHGYHLALRRIVVSTGARTLMAALLPPGVLYDDTLLAESSRELGAWSRLYLVAVLNSFVLDYFARQLQNGRYVFYHLLESLPVPRLPTSHDRLRAVARRSARLICTTPEFDACAREVGLRGHGDGAVEFAERERLQAEIEGLVAHLYGLTEEEFAHVLSTFPLVAEPQRIAARNAYRDVALGVLP